MEMLVLAVDVGHVLLLLLEECFAEAADVYFRVDQLQIQVQKLDLTLYQLALIAQNIHPFLLLLKELWQVATYYVFILEKLVVLEVHPSMLLHLRTLLV